MRTSIDNLIVNGLSLLIVDIVSKAVRHCGSVHNFDAEEMIRSLNISDMKLSVSSLSPVKEKVIKEKVIKEKVIKSKLPMPFSGLLKEGCCNALRQNHGLYTQCETAVIDEMYCNKCGPNPEHGTIQERLKVGIMEFRDKKGKAPTSFCKVMKKLKISRSEVEEEAGKLNIIINDIHFVEEEVEKKEKGRPKKPKRIIELADDSTDLFAALVAKANEVDYGSDEEDSNDEKSSIAESIIDTVLDKVDVIIENNEKEAEKQALIEKKESEKQKKEAEKAEKEAEKQKKEAEKQALIQKKEEEKQALIKKKEEEKQALIQKKEEEKQALIQKKEAEKQALIQKKEAEKAEKQKKIANKPDVSKESKSKKESSESETEKKSVVEKKPVKKVEEEEENDVVKRFEFDGVKYLKSKKYGIIYNMDQDAIGKWNEKTGKIDFYESDSEEEEEEYVE